MDTMMGNKWSIWLNDAFRSYTDEMLSQEDSLKRRAP